MIYTENGKIENFDIFASGIWNSYCIFFETLFIFYKFSIYNVDLIIILLIITSKGIRIGVNHS